MAQHAKKRKTPSAREILSSTDEQGGGFAERGEAWDAGLPERLDVQVGPAGRIVIPAVYRKAMQVKEGDRLMARVVDGELRLISPEMGIRKAQKLVRETIPGNDSLIDTLMEQRRQEVADEFGDR